MRKFSVGKRRAVLVRGGNAMDGRKRAGITALGRSASKAAKRGFANRRTSLWVISFMAGLNAARVHTPDRKLPVQRGEKCAAQTPEPKPLM